MAAQEDKLLLCCRAGPSAIAESFICLSGLISCTLVGVVRSSVLYVWDEAVFARQDGDEADQFRAIRILPDQLVTTMKGRAPRPKIQNSNRDSATLKSF